MRPWAWGEGQAGLRPPGGGQLVAIRGAQQVRVRGQRGILQQGRVRGA